MKLRDIAFVAIGCALLCVLAPLSIPIGAVPITLATFAVYLIGAIYSPIKATAAVALYVLLGLAGVPVFSGYKSGLAVLSGPTGGFIIGYIPAVLIQSILTTKFKEKKASYVFGIILGTIFIYGFGLAWFLISTNGKYTFNQAMATCVYPFLIGDTVKLVVSVILGYRLRPYADKANDFSHYRSAKARRK